LLGHVIENRMAGITSRSSVKNHNLEKRWGNIIVFTNYCRTWQYL